MGKIILISGPNGSGKSRFAEGLAEKFPGRRYYIATMKPQTEDNLRRIQRHRNSGKSWISQRWNCPTRWERRIFPMIPSFCWKTYQICLPIRFLNTMEQWRRYSAIFRLCRKRAEP